MTHSSRLARAALAHRSSWLMHLVFTTSVIVIGSGCGGETTPTSNGQSGNAGSSGGGGSSGGQSGSSGQSGSAGSQGCTGENPSQLKPGQCRNNDDCDAGITCDMTETECVSSSCTCDEETGDWTCSADCGLVGRCSTCDQPNPAGCAQTGCGPEELCTPTSGVCVPSSCTCDSKTGGWACTDDCSGGMCVPKGSGLTCGGISPTACGEGFYCDYEQDVCGNNDNFGYCTARPTACDENCPGVCGCDGQFYCNSCIAASMGIDVSANGTCTNQ